MDLEQKFWKGKKVLLTGHTGFKGSWMALWLQSMDVDLCGFSKGITTSPNLYEIANVKENMKSIFGDIQSYEKISSVINEFNPEIIIHMAAQSIVLRSYKDPLETYNTNVLGTLNLLESVRKTDSTRVIINVTSDKCYDNRGLGIPFKETDPMGGFDPYSSSKGCSEILTASFRNSFFNPEKFHEHKVALASVRAGNVIGGGDWSDYRLIPDLIKGIQNNKIVKIRNKNFSRPWQHVLEPLNGYLLLAEKLWNEGSLFSQAWNFGPIKDEKRQVSYIIERFMKEFNELKIHYEENENYESENLRLDSDKANEQLGWKNKYNLDETIELTIEWYKKFFEGSNMKEVSKKHIENFVEL